MRLRINPRSPLDQPSAELAAEAAPAVLLLRVVDGAGERLDKWLAEQLPDRSRAEIQRWIAAGLVTARGRACKASHRVVLGDEIAVQAPAPANHEVKPEPIPLSVLYEDGDLLVVDKPAGMVVHPAAGNWHGTLVSAVLRYSPGLAGVGDAQRPGIVHRLDKDTSGLILVAKNERTHRTLQAQFKQRQVEKTYLALVYGHISPPTGEIAAAIGRDPRRRQRMAVVDASQGRPAVTRYEVLNTYRGCTLLACKPLTGRTHQIRVHLAYLKHPIVGDSVYGGRRKPEIACPRQFLHAYRLRFRLPSSGQEVEFTAPLPADLQAVLDQLAAES